MALRTDRDFKLVQMRSVLNWYRTEWLYAPIETSIGPKEVSIKLEVDGMALRTSLVFKLDDTMSILNWHRKAWLYAPTETSNWSE